MTAKPGSPARRSATPAPPVPGRLGLHMPSRARWMVLALNLLGCILFGVAAVAGHVLPATGSVLDLAAVN